MSRESKTSVKKKSSKSPSRAESPSTPSTPKNPSSVNEGEGGGENKDDNPGPFTPPSKETSKLDGVEPLPQTPSETTRKTSTPGSATSGPLVRVPSEGTKDKKKKETSHTPKKGRGGGTPRGGHNGSKSRRGEMKFGERPGRPMDSKGVSAGMNEPGEGDDGHFDPSKYERMTALYFHKHNDLSRSARGVGYSPNQAVSQYGPGVTNEAEILYGPCRLLTDFQYSTWTETVVPLRNHNVVQGFNEMILFLIKLAANPDGPVNHEEAFMATSFLANIRNDLGEHPPNVLALLEYIDYKTLDDGTEPADPEVEVMTPCKASERY